MQKYKLVLFLLPHKCVFCIGVFFFLAICIRIIEEAHELGPLVSCVFFCGITLVCAAICFRTCVAAIRLRKQFIELEEAGETENVLRAFLEGNPVLKRRLRLANKYIFGKGSGVILRYDQIALIYEHTYKKGFREQSRVLEVYTNNKKTYELCELPLWGNQTKEVDAICELIEYKKARLAGHDFIA